MAERKELNVEEVEHVNGGAYVTVSMTVGEIIATDRNLTGILAQVGIPAVGNKGAMGMSLYEVAQNRGIDPYVIEKKMNDYLGSK